MVTLMRRRLAIALGALALASLAGTSHFIAHSPNGARVRPGPLATSADTSTSPTPLSAPAAATTATATTLSPAPSDPVARLRDALTWSDDAARIDAIDAAIASGATETLPLLERVVLAGDPEAAPTVIHGVAVLGAKAGTADRRVAAQTLSQWLRDEGGREGADARGNVSVLVDALGDLGGADAADALAGALDRATLPLHVETLAAQRLTQLGEPSARDAIARFSARVAALPPTQGIDETLRVEALALATNGQP